MSAPRVADPRSKVACEAAVKDNFLLVRVWCAWIFVCVYTHMCVCAYVYLCQEMSDVRIWEECMHCTLCRKLGTDTGIGIGTETGSNWGPESSSNTSVAAAAMYMPTFGMSLAYQGPIYLRPEPQTFPPLHNWYRLCLCDVM